MITDEMFKKGKFWTDGPMVVTGCTKVSEGCKNCWSEKFHVRQSQSPNSHVWPADCLTDKHFNGKVHFNLDALRKAVKGKKPKVIAIWNDLHHEGVSYEKRHKAYDIMEDNYNHTFLVITKRPEIASHFICKARDWGNIYQPQFIYHIATMENQARADERMGDLLRIPGKRGIIIEPMLGPVDISESFYCSWTEGMEMPYEDGYCRIGCDREDNDCDGNPSSLISQVILGPENGTGKRYMNPEWAESVKAQCEGAGVPFYRKDKGEGELAWR